MIIDARTLDSSSKLHADVCVIGAGPAGLTLALELGRLGVEVCVLESGSIDWDPSSYRLSVGENVGLLYKDLEHSRWRGFGGSATFWSLDVGVDPAGARYRPLDPIDLESRSWVPRSGWPFGIDELTSHYEKAQEICGLGPLDYTVGGWALDRDGNHPFVTPSFEPIVFQGGPAGRFTRDPLAVVGASENLRLYHHVTVHELEMQATGDRVCEAHAVTRVGSEVSATAAIFVLAGGGIENPRLLLVSRGRRRAGVGNEHGLVGTHFMEHFHALTAVLIPGEPGWLEQPALHSWHVVRGTPVQQMYRIRETTVRSDHLLGYCFSLVPTAVAGLPADVRSDIERAGGAPGDWILGVDVMSEQAPNPMSRVTRSDRVDHAGLMLMAPHSRQPSLSWQPADLDVRTLLRGQELVAEEFQRAGVGTVLTRLTRENIDRELYGGDHHMGTTRMHDDPAQGVVDADCRVHSTENLYIAGSSVFPTGGYANPTLTIVALAVRLAARLRRVLGAG